MIVHSLRTRTVRMVLAALTCMASASAQVRTFKTLYAFSDGADGGAPWDAPLISNGQVFGTTYNGGGAGSAQVGTVFQYDPLSGLETYYYIFNGLPFDGAYPMSGMTADPFGDFFGTTIQGGYGLKGTVYEITGGAESVVYSFSGPDGESPESNLTIDADGNVYGVTGAGGANGAGTVFALSGGASFVEVYSFGNSKDDGIDPAANMCIFKAVLYGTTAEGGKNRWGTIFSVNPATKAEAILYDFRGGPNGGTPTGGLIPDNKGNLYGTASVGGSGNGNTGNGLLFRINIKSATLTVVHKFIGTDGSDPTGPLITDGAGNFYGTTFAGGTKGYGTVYQYDATTNVFTSLYSFTNETDGAYPYGGVTSDSSGNLYGTATRGGLYNWGTLFELTAAP